MLLKEEEERVGEKIRFKKGRWVITMFYFALLFRWESTPTIRGKNKDLINKKDREGKLLNVS